MNRRTPLGVDAGPSNAEGVAAYAGSARPGSLGFETDDTSSRSAAASASPSAAVDRGADVSTSFALGSDAYRLLRVDAHWRQGFDEVRVPPRQAEAVIEQAAREYQGDADVAALLASAMSRLAGLHENGVFLLLQKRAHGAESTAAVAQSAPVSTPAALRSPAPPAPPLPTVDEPVMGVEQAMALKSAAARGVPFCEECARAAAERAAFAAA